MKSKISTVIINDHMLFAQGLAALLNSYPEISLTAILLNNEDVFKHLRKRQVDLVIVNLIRLGEDGLSTCRALSQSHPNVSIMVISFDFNLETAKKLKQFGVKGYLTKEIEPSDLINTIHQIVSGNYDLPDVHELMRLSKQSFENMLNGFEVSSREKEIILLICRGLTSPEIADKLFVSLNTIKQHRKNIFRKLKIKSMKELIAFGIRNNLQLQ